MRAERDIMAAAFKFIRHRIAQKAEISLTDQILAMAFAYDHVAALHVNEFERRFAAISHHLGCPANNLRRGGQYVDIDRAKAELLPICLEWVALRGRHMHFGHVGSNDIVPVAHPPGSRQIAG